MKRYYYQDNQSQVQGPFPESSLASLYVNFKITSATLICEEGTNDWRPLSDSNLFKRSDEEPQKHPVSSELLPTTEIFILKNEVQEGPYNPSQIKNMWEAGGITMNALIWHSKLTGWIPISELVNNNAFFKKESNPLTRIDSRLKWIGTGIGLLLLGIMIKGCTGGH